MASEKIQSKIINALVNAAFLEEDFNNDLETAEAIRCEASKMAKRWGITEVSGLPKTWKINKSIPDYT